MLASLTMLASLRVAPGGCVPWSALRVPSPCVARRGLALPGRGEKAGSLIELESRICDVAVWTTLLRSGLSVTMVIGVQLRVCPLQRRRLRSRAFW